MPTSRAGAGSWCLAVFGPVFAWWCYFAPWSLLAGLSSPFLPPKRARPGLQRVTLRLPEQIAPPGERSWPAPTFFPLNQTQLPPGPPGTPSTHPAPTKPAPCLGLHLTLTTTSLRPLLLHPSSSTHLTAPHLPPSPPARRTATSTSCGLLARPAASCHFYERDGLRRPLDNGCSLMRSRNGRIEVVKTAPTLPTIFVTTLL